MQEKIKSFKDLNAWKIGHELVLMVYKITTDFPREEIFGIISQMRRCAVSITSNIAEGFSRQSPKEKTQFYSTSLGSLTELDNQLTIARDIKYISENEYLKIMDKLVTTQKLICGLIKYSKSQNTKY